MLDHAFRRRTKIQRMLLSGRKLTVKELTAEFNVGRKVIIRDFEVIGEVLPVVTKRGNGGGYCLTDGVNMYQNTLSREQLECLEKIKVTCAGKDKKTIQSIIHEFGPYRMAHT